MTGALAILQLVLRIAGALARWAERKQLLDAGKAQRTAEIAANAKEAQQEVRDIRARLRDPEFRKRVRERAKRAGEQSRLL